MNFRVWFLEDKRISNIISGTKSELVENHSEVLNNEKVSPKGYLYSEITKMCISKVEHPKCKMLNRNSIGSEVRGVLTRARVERRLICGLLPAITYLEKNPDDTLLCMLPLTRPGDAATHMQTVLLQAFCYENYIPVIQVDSSERLAEFCGIPQAKGRPTECSCAIITRDPNNSLNPDEDPPLSPSEQTLTDFYECTLEEYPRPVVHLPSLAAT